MRDRFALPLLVLIAAAMIALGLVWPQGQGTPSPSPFGHPMAAPEKDVTVDGRHLGSIRGAQEAAEDALQSAK